MRRRAGERRRGDEGAREAVGATTNKSGVVLLLVLFAFIRVRGKGPPVPLGERGTSIGTSSE